MIPLMSSPQSCHAERGLSFAIAELNRSRSTPTPTAHGTCSADTPVHEKPRSTMELREASFEKARFHSLQKNSLLFLLLGGAAVHRCDTCLILSAGFSRWGTTAPTDRVFQQTVQPGRGHAQKPGASAPEGCSQ